MPLDTSRWPALQNTLNDYLLLGCAAYNVLLNLNELIFFFWLLWETLTWEVKASENILYNMK